VRDQQGYDCYLFGALTQVNAPMNFFSMIARECSPIYLTQGDLMQIHNMRSNAKVTTDGKRDDLLVCRMAMLGLDLHEIECGDGETLDNIKRRCTTCNVREACVVDLKRDPNNPVWESYCPNSEALIALTDAWWRTH
jgi:hypothetical protein